MWNNLPDDIKTADSLGLFRQGLETFDLDSRIVSRRSLPRAHGWHCVIYGALLVQLTYLPRTSFWLLSFRLYVADERTEGTSGWECGQKILMAGRREVRLPIDPTVVTRSNIPPSCSEHIDNIDQSHWVGVAVSLDLNVKVHSYDNLVLVKIYYLHVTGNLLKKCLHNWCWVRTVNNLNRSLLNATTRKLNAVMKSR